MKERMNTKSLDSAQRPKKLDSKSLSLSLFSSVCLAFHSLQVRWFVRDSFRALVEDRYPGIQSSRLHPFPDKDFMLTPPRNAA